MIKKVIKKIADGTETTWILFNLPILKKKRSIYYRKFYFFNFLFYYKKFYDYPLLTIQDFEQSTLSIELMNLNQLAEETQVWFDHTLGGGTQSYFEYQCTALKEKYLCIRIQNNTADSFIISYYYKNIQQIFILKDIQELNRFLFKLKLNFIVVNNFAGYRDYISVLHLITRLKKQTNVTVSYRTHDYQSICFDTNMINAHNVYCNCKQLQDCQSCLQEKGEKQIEQELSLKYHFEWRNFFINIADEIIVFSQASQDILERLFPIPKEKILLVPHKSNPLRAVDITAHATINIAILGSISKIKGALIVKKMGELLKENNTIKIKIIGTLSSKYVNFFSYPRKIYVYGNYKREDLPQIMEKEQIDIIFIPSIWPETYSYTTDEAMFMQLPLACFNLGAPAQRVKNYPKGLVIENIDAEYALERIIDFVKKTRNET